MRKFKKFIFSFLAFAMLSAPLQVHAASPTQQESPTLNNPASEIYIGINDDVIDLILPETVIVFFRSPTNVRLLDTMTGEIETLPTHATGMDGMSILLSYTLTEDGLSVEMILPMYHAHLPWKWRCLSGMLGSGLTGFIGGAAGLGPVGGAIGGIGGILVGAASFCL